MREDSKKCRSCLIDNLDEKTISLQDIYDKENKQFSTIYEYVTGFKIDENGPQKLCDKCKDDLLVALEFKKRCAKSEEILSGTIHVKTEINEEHGNFNVTITEEQQFSETDVQAKADPESILFVTSANIWDEPIPQSPQIIIEKPVPVKYRVKTESTKNITEDEEEGDILEPETHIEAESNANSEESDGSSSQSSDDSEKERRHKTVKSKKSKPITCPYCTNGKIYKDKDNLRKHCRKVHQDQKLQCPECDEAFYLTYQLKRHRRTAHEKRSYSRSKSSYDPSKQEKSICCHCGKIMAAHYMDRHINDVHLKAHVIYTCDICKTVMHTKGGLISHMRRKHMDVKYECSYCKESFPSYGIRRTHELRFHTFAYKFSCNLCGHKFISNRDLRKHRVTHTGEKNFRCEICGIQVSRKSVLNLHMAVHSDARPFSCEVCAASFKTKKALKVHYGVHNERNYECPVCNQKFLVNQAMRLHAQKRHPDYVLPPPGTVMNKSALARIQEINAKYNVNYKTTPRIYPKIEPGTTLDPATGQLITNSSQHLIPKTEISHTPTPPINAQNQHQQIMMQPEQKPDLTHHSLHHQYTMATPQSTLYHHQAHNTIILQQEQAMQMGNLVNTMPSPFLNSMSNMNTVIPITSPGGNSMGGGQ